MKRSTLKRSTLKRSTLKRSTLKRSTLKRSTLKRSTIKTKKIRAHRRKGGMFSRAAKKVFTEVLKGKNPVESADKVKDVVQAIVNGLTPRPESTPVTPGTTPTFSTSHERMRIGFNGFNGFNDLNESNSPFENRGLYTTPVKGKHSSGSDDDINPFKFIRHQSRRVITPYSYAPSLNEPISVVTGNLFDHIDEDDE
jgi:hypothetical protein